MARSLQAPSPSDPSNGCPRSAGGFASGPYPRFIPSKPKSTAPTHLRLSTAQSSLWST
jgi:hypothetical protein